MSYCRFIEGDVYMYASVYGGIDCCACKSAGKVKTIFSPGAKISSDDIRKRWAKDICDCDDQCDSCTIHGNVNFKTYEEAITHLEEHVAAGHEVPERAFERLRSDIENKRSLSPCLCSCGQVACLFDAESDEPPKCLDCGLPPEKDKYGELHRALDNFMDTVARELGLYKLLDLLTKWLKKGK